jgi:hypothetical protein
MFLHRDVHKYTWIFPHSHIDGVLIDGIRRSSVLDVRCFRGADCGTDHCFVVAEVRERLAVSKRGAQKTDGEI